MGQLNNYFIKNSPSRGMTFRFRKTIFSDSSPFVEVLKIRLEMRSFHQQFLLVFYKHYKVNISENGVCDVTFQRIKINIPIQWHLDLLYL